MGLLKNLQTLENSVLARAIETTRSPLIITDNQQPDNPIVYANKAFLDLCGYSEKEILGKNCRFLQGEDRQQTARSELRTAIDANQDVRVTIKNYRKDGTPFWNDLLVSPIKDDSGKTTHFIGMQLDITERIEYTKELEQIQEKLRQSNQELEQFTYAASHDLQEPLRMVSSYLQLINRRYGGTLDNDGHVFMNFAIEGAERMQALINDLLALSRVSTMTKKFRATPFKEIVEKAEFNLKLQIDESHAKIKVGRLPSLQVDSVQMVQLMQNLISNALKYRRPDEVPEITISAQKDGDYYIFSVQDNGIGIDPQYHDRVFVIFQRLYTRDEYPGTGVGLALCSKIIERHRGTIWVESDGKHGSSFKFRLPTRHGKDV